MRFVLLAGLCNTCSIFNLLLPSGTFASTTSPRLRPRTAVPTGARMEIRPLEAFAFSGNTSIYRTLLPLVKSPFLRLKILFCPIWLDTPTTAILGFWSRRRPTLCRLHKSCDLPNAAKRQRLVFVTFHTLNSSSSGAATLIISSGCQKKRQHASSGRMNWRSGGAVGTRPNQIFLPGGNVSNGANNLRFSGRRIASRTAGFPVVTLQDRPFLRPREGYWKTIEEDFHWHLEVLPQVIGLTGFERASWFFYNPVSPELATRCLSG
jgi:hypothetical protein